MAKRKKPLPRSSPIIKGLEKQFGRSSRLPTAAQARNRKITAGKKTAAQRSGSEIPSSETPAQRAARIARERRQAQRRKQKR